jgi:hypothetical protein
VVAGTRYHERLNKLKLKNDVVYLTYEDCFMCILWCFAPGSVGPRCIVEPCCIVELCCGRARWQCTATAAAPRAEVANSPQCRMSPVRGSGEQRARGRGGRSGCAPAFVQDLLVKVHGNKSRAEYIKNRAEAAGEGLGNGHYWDDNQGAEAPRVLLCWTCHVYSVAIVS